MRSWYRIFIFNQFILKKLSTLELLHFKRKAQKILWREKEREKEGRGNGESKAEYNVGILKCQTFWLLVTICLSCCKWKKDFIFCEGIF